MLAELIACIGFATVGAPPSGPKAMPNMIHRPETYEQHAEEPPQLADEPGGLLQYDLDSAYLPDVVGGYLEIVVGSDSSTVAEESRELLLEVATLLKERPDLDVWVTASLANGSRALYRQTALAVEAVVSELRRLGIERVPFRIWRPDEYRPPNPLNTLEIRVLTSVERPVS